MKCTWWDVGKWCKCSVIRCQKDESRLRLTGLTAQPMSCMICWLIKPLLPDISYLWLVSWLIVADDATQGKERRMLAFLIFDCTFAHLLTAKHRPRSLVKEKFDFSAYVVIFRRQSDWESKCVVFTTTLSARSKFNTHPGHVVASLDKQFYDD